MESYICKRNLFRVDLKTCQFFFYINDIVITFIVLLDTFRVYFIISNGFNKLFLLNFYHSCVYSCNLKSGTCVIGKQTIVACVLVIES